VENIVTRDVQGKDMTVPLKKDLTEQLPFLKKLNLRYKDFARNTLQELIPDAQLKKALVLKSFYHSTIVAWNKGDGTFDIERLPMEVQLSCVTAIATHDMNHDGRPDLIIGGNNYGFLPQFSRLDANPGYILINEGKEQWHVMNHNESGWSVKGEMKSIDIFPFDNKSILMTIRNNDKPSIFSFDAKEDIK
jgi:hypothetical protein